MKIFMELRPPRFVATLLALTSFGSYNSGYAARYRSLKPLRASHTRQTLYVIATKLKVRRFEK